MSTTYEPIEDKGNQSPSLFGNGLDESDVLLFINSLMEQNSELAEKLEQAESLAKLAMEGPQDAPQQAESAKAEADRIITEAKRTAESYAREKVASAEQQAQAMLKAAEEKAESIITTAEDEASRITHEERQKTESARWQAKEILTAAEVKARDVKARAEREASKIVLEAKSRAEQEAEQILEKNKAADNKGEIKETLAAILTQLKGSYGKQSAQVPEQEDINKKEQSALYNGYVELEIPPPLAMGPLTNLAKYLKNTGQIEVLALNSTSNHGLKIRIFIHKPLPLIHILESLPLVEKVSRESRENQGKQSSRSKSGNGSIMVKMRN